ncbi:MAG TPA: anti-sigma factor antagonist [Chloroflexota bacterium]|nr:anti-sigma factor antagonist [Chloroflexota bacterium]
MKSEPETASEAALVLPDGTRYAIPSEGAIIGRRSDSDILIDDPSVSRRHAQILYRDGRYYLVDLGSSNGTTLNGRPVTRPAPLAHGDVLQLGGTRLTFALRPQPARERQPVATGPAAPAEAQPMVIPLRSPEPAGTAAAPAGAARLQLVASALRPEPGGVAVQLRLRGVLDIETADQFREQARRLLAAGATHFLLDLQELEYLDSSGLGALVALHRQVAARAGEVRLQHPQPAIRGILELTRLDRVFALQ